MKKFYSFVIMAALAFSASATQLVKPARQAKTAVDRIETVAKKLNLPLHEKSAVAKAPAKAAANAYADENWVELGQGTMIDGFVIPMFLEDLSYLEMFPLSVTVWQSADNEGLYRIEMPYTGAEFNEILTGNINTTPTSIVLDATNPDFVKFAIQYSGMTFPGFNPFDQTDTSGADSDLYISDIATVWINMGLLDEQDIIDYGMGSTFKNGVFTIMPACDVTDDPAKFMGYSVEGAVAKISIPGASLDGRNPAEWRSIGKGMFEDGFIVPGYLKGEKLANPADYAYEVEVEVDDANPGIYRIVNPFACANYPAAEHNLMPEETYLEIDATDPDLVKIMIQYTGFNAMYEDEPVQFYVADYAGFISAMAGDAMAKQMIESNPGAATTLQDGMFNIPFCGYGFGSSPYEFGGYTWVEEGSEDIDMPTYPARLHLPGVNAVKDIEFDNADAPVEYFNLQGIRVANPANGIFIRRQGNKALKVAM